MRRYDPLFLELQLDDRFISESEFWQAIVEHPRLINAPVLASANKARIVRSANDVKSFLGQDVPQQAKPKGLSPRMAALMKGHALPPKVETRVEKIEPAPKPVAKPEPQIKIPLKPPIKLPAKPAPDVKAKKAVAEKKPVKTVAKKIPAAKPVKKAVKKTAKKK
ncbi:MAG TPA: ArsC/Spx/MgsR family protein [Rhizomicrobium sp.]|nr:ArsC/Spx/MgsR family protein [Rhizomicrobium sp.]